MTVSGFSHAVPGGTKIVGALDAARLLLQTEETLAVFDGTTGAVTRQRTIPGLTYATVHGAWIVVHDAGGPGLVRGDLGGEEIRWPDAQKLRLGGIVGSVAVLFDPSERMRFDLERLEVIDRVPEDTCWYGAHQEEGLLLGVRERRREIVALRPRDGAIVWATNPFGRTVDSIGHPCGRGDEVHVRASAVDDTVVARIGAHDGAVRNVRPAPADLDSWLPDLGEEVCRSAARFRRRRSTFAAGDAIVVPQDDQLIVVRASGVARVATPYLNDMTHFGGSVAGIVADRTRIELVVIPLPAQGEQDLELVPRGEEAVLAAGVPAVVTFAGTSAPIVIVQHPQYGRVNLTRDGSGPPPPLGAEVVLDGVDVRPGGVVKVERWWIAGVRAPRETARFALAPAAMTEEARASGSTHFAQSLAARAKEEGIAVPGDIVRFVEVVDRDPAFRRALASLGFHFEEEELGLDVLPELEIEGFVPVWGNGYFDGYGGVTREGTLGYLHVKDDHTPQAMPPLAEHVRAEAKDSELEATAAAVLTVLDRERL